MSRVSRLECRGWMLLILRTDCLNLKAYQHVLSVLNCGLDCEGYRLPTEAEWEFLAKAGTEQLFAGANSPAGVAIFEWNSDDRLSPVAQKRPNQWGLYDMSGNAFEWCLDDFVEEPVRQLDPLYILDSTRKVGRGGSFRSKEEAIRSTSRSSAAMDVQRIL